PCSIAVSSQRRRASSKLARVSKAVSPCARQPGRSGFSATKPPSGCGWRTTGYLRARDGADRARDSGATVSGVMPVLQFEQFDDAAHVRPFHLAASKLWQDQHSSAAVAKDVMTAPGANLHEAEGREKHSDLREQRLGRIRQKPIDESSEARHEAPPQRNDTTRDIFRPSIDSHLSGPERSR